MYKEIQNIRKINKNIDVKKNIIRITEKIVKVNKIN